jgi:hypothetical protein
MFKKHTLNKWQKICYSITCTALRSRSSCISNCVAYWHSNVLNIASFYYFNKIRYLQRDSVTGLTWIQQIFGSCLECKLPKHVYQRHSYMSNIHQALVHVQHNTRLFHLPTLMHNSLFIKLYHLNVWILILIVVYDGIYIYIISQYVCYITILDMFRASTCPSSGGQNVLSQHLVSSLSVQYGTITLYSRLQRVRY